MKKTQTSKISPLFSRIFVKQDEADERSPGGILLPEQAKDKPKQGIVMAVGIGKSLPEGGFREMTVRVGDRVIFRAYGSTEIKLDGETMLVMDEDDVLAIIEDCK